MKFLNSAISWFIRQRFNRIEWVSANSVETQKKIFSYLIQQGEDTEWGKLYRYASIKDAKAFKAIVPIQDYDTLKPYIQRMMAGQQNVLWPSEINWFAKSSGTTGDKSKFIPVSKEALRDSHLKGGRDALALFLRNYPPSNIFSGKGLIMGGSSQINQLNEDCYYGDVSAVMMHHLPLLAHLIKTPELSVALMDDWEEKLNRMAELTVKQNVTHLVGVPTWTLVLLNRILEMTGKETLPEVWPNLQLYIHGGVSFTPYREQFQRLIPSPAMCYQETYNASEGFFGIQASPDTQDMLLMPDYGIYYEFIPLDQLDKRYPETLCMHEVEVGKQYALVISTSAGLWRYKIGDTVEFTSINPYKIKVSGRVKHFINAFGEEVIIDNADGAIAAACCETGAAVSDYTVAPIYFGEDKKGGHEWLIEFERGPKDIITFTKALDEALKSLNSDYEAKRFKDIALQLPVVHHLPKQTFYNWLKSNGKLGGQHKVPRLSNNREYVDDILRFIED